MQGMSLVSADFADGDYLPEVHVLSTDFGFGCEGGNRSPQLTWSDVPEGTESFTVTCYDPDAPTGSGFWHWVVVNIPADVRELPQGAGKPDGSGLPAGAVQTRTDFGSPGYGGPCPPQGDHPHRYLFTVHAVPGTLDVTPDTSAAVIGFMLHFQSLGSATLMGLYKH